MSLGNLKVDCMRTYEVNDVAVERLEVIQIAVWDLRSESLQNHAVERPDDFPAFVHI